MSDLFAAIDCGTNSVRLLLTRLVDGQLEQLDRRLHLTRLGQGVDATGEFAPDALARTFAAFEDFAEEIAEAGGAKTRVVATSAARDARNSAAFFSGARDIFGVDAEIISGAEEAELSFQGAVSSLGEIAGPVLVMDIGGGSTELVLGTATPQKVVSLDMGSVRIRERFLASDPPTVAEVEASEDFINSLLDRSGIDFSTAATWVGVGGTATCLSAIVQQLAVYDSTPVHGSWLTQDSLDVWTGRLLRMPTSKVKALPSMEPGRADVICAGALICREIGVRTDLPLIVSESDILDGIVQRLVSE